MDYEKIKEDYNRLFPKEVSMLNNFGEWVNWREWQKSINNDRKPYIVNHKLSIKHNKISVNFELYYDGRVSSEEVMTKRLVMYRNGQTPWEKKYEDYKTTIRFKCVDFYNDNFVIDNNSIELLFEAVEFLLKSGCLILSKEYQKIRSLAYQIVKYAKKRIPKIKPAIKKEYCYIMKDSINGLYKIGKSNNPKIREKTLQSEKPSINMIKVFDKNIEKELHNRYKRERVRGEWFNLNKIQLRYICTHF